MISLRVSAHITPDTESVIRAFDGADSFVSLRVGDGDTDVVFMAALGTADALRDLATAANKAATVLDELASRTQDGAA